MKFKIHISIYIIYLTLLGVYFGRNNQVSPNQQITVKFTNANSNANSAIDSIKRSAAYSRR